MPWSARSDPTDGPPASGRLEGTSIPELLHEIGRAGFSGSLILERGDTEKVLFWREGSLAFAASSDPEDRLGALLLRRGQVGVDALAAAGRKVEPGYRLGQVLVADGWLDGDAIARAVVDQLREIVLSVFPWRDGSWRMTRTTLSSEPVVLEDSVPELILAGVRRVQDWPWIRRAVGGPRAVYRAAESAGGRPPLGLVERSVLRVLEGPERVERLCREVYAPAYEVYRSLWALSILGLVEAVGPERLERELDEEREGRLGDRGVPEVLLDLADERFTGVLRLFGPGEDGSLHLREGRVVFATTRNPEMSLLVHLLRRGVISDSDHEAALRRLISGKRIGALLAERGALASGDVERFVREQVAEVACALTRRRRGEYTLERELPSDEPVTLDWSVEDLIVAALESAEAFEPVWESLGGLEARFRLRPEYLERLDRMRLRTLAWEIVSALREERTLGELLAGRPEPDYDVCRMIYALERVRVLERSPDSPAEPERAPFLAEAVPEPAEASAASGEDAAPEPPGFGRAGVAAELAPELFGLPPEPHGPVSVPIDVTQPGPPEPEPPVEEVPAEEPPAEEVEPELAETPGGEDVLEELAEELSVGEPAGVEEPGRSRSLPGDVVRTIERFNRRHRIMFEELRREIGAGVRNYVLTCQRRLGELSSLFADLEPDRSGAFDVDALGRALLSYRERARPAAEDEALLETLIEKEILIVRDLLPESRLEEIRHRLSAEA